MHGGTPGYSDQGAIKPLRRIRHNIRNRHRLGKVQTTSINQAQATPAHMHQPNATRVRGTTPFTNGAESQGESCMVSEQLVMKEARTKWGLICRRASLRRHDATSIIARTYQLGRLL